MASEQSERKRMGRPPLPPDERSVPLSVRISQKERARIAELGIRFEFSFSDIARGALLCGLDTLESGSDDDAMEVIYNGGR